MRGYSAGTEKRAVSLVGAQLGYAAIECRSMSRPVCNRTYSAVIPCSKVQPPTASSHIKSPKKGHGSPFSTRALVFYHMVYENATTF